MIADVAFLIDSSGSIHLHYKDELKSVKAVAGAFKLSKDGTRAGVVSFSSNARVDIKLNENFTTASFNKVSAIFHLFLRFANNFYGLKF